MLSVASFSACLPADFPMILAGFDNKMKYGMQSIWKYGSQCSKMADECFLA